MKNKITILGNLIFDNWFLFVINTLIYIDIHIFIVFRVEIYIRR